jgi:hypothetical protein
MTRTEEIRKEQNFDGEPLGKRLWTLAQTAKFLTCIPQVIIWLSASTETVLTGDSHGFPQGKYPDILKLTTITPIYFAVLHSLIPLH